MVLPVWQSESGKHKLWQFAVISVLFVVLPLSAVAGKGAELCMSAAASASAKTGVPIAVLRAIALTETGRKHDGAFQPWPWSINTSGQGHWFESRAALTEAALANLAARVTSFDVGCFQLNYRWHSRNFDSLDAMIDPDRNALYAAEFLSRLYSETGDWTEAAGAYHSRTKEHATNYKAKFKRHYSPSSGGEHQVTKVVRKTTGNDAYPLIRMSNATTRLGSLVPVVNP